MRKETLIEMIPDWVGWIIVVVVAAVGCTINLIMYWKYLKKREGVE